jgi:hypothetical protein
VAAGRTISSRSSKRHVLLHLLEEYVHHDRNGQISRENVWLDGAPASRRGFLSPNQKRLRKGHEYPHFRHCARDGCLARIAPTPGWDDGQAYRWTVLDFDGSRSEAKADRAAADFRKSSQAVRLLRVQVFPTHDERVKQILCARGRSRDSQVHGRRGDDRHAAARRAAA